MFKIIDTVTDPIRYFSAALISPGQIVQTSDFGVKVCDGYLPFGVAISETDNSGLIQILLGTAIIQTDKFESVNYTSGNLLFASSRGYFTTKKVHDNAILIGYVIFGPGKNRDYLECSIV